ncbi:MAG: hypothetical protein E7459_09850 [Ruminococcaceae bacterium]|nr:hypothetical protein [Oscillospiraceae bacterium]
MSSTPRKPAMGLQCLYLTALLAPVGWVRFLLLTRNIFHLEQYTGGDFALGLLLSVIPLIGNLLAWHSRRKRPQNRWLWVPAAVVLLLTALGWALALGNGWNNWQSALHAHRIDDGQLLRLFLSALAGMLGAAVPLGVMVWPERGSALEA